MKLFNRELTPEQTIGFVRIQKTFPLPCCTDGCIVLDAANDLADMVERLTKERDALKESNDGLCISHDNIYTRLNEMTARAEKTEAEMDAAVADLTKFCTKPVTPCYSCARRCLKPANMSALFNFCNDWKWRLEEKRENE
jgi:hypothetical protein